MTRFLAGDEIGGAACSIEGAALAGAAGFAYQEALLLHNAGDSLISAGDDERARETLRRSLAIATANRFDMLAAYNSALLSYLDLDEDPTAHLRTIERSTRFVRAVGSPWAALSLQLIVARATLRSGKRAAARELAQRIHAEASSLGYDRGRVEAENLLAEIGMLRTVVSVPPAAAPGQADGVIERVRQGHRWTPEEANEFLVAFHAARPGVTARAVRGNHTAEGLTSYDLTASYVPAAARVVVDVACGDGALLLALARRLSAIAEVVGVDLSAVDLELARRRLGTTPARFLCENAEHTSLAGASADAVVSHYALMLMRPIDTVLTEAARVLRPGGVFVACVPGGSVNRSPTEARQLLLDAIRADVPLYPETGLGDSRVHDDSAIAALLAGAGFEGVRVDSHVIACELTPAEAFAEMRDYYWWDLIREETRSRLERELMPLLMNEAAASGKLRRATQLRMIVAQRTRATS